MFVHVNIVCTCAVQFLMFIVGKLMIGISSNLLHNNIRTCMDVYQSKLLILLLSLLYSFRASITVRPLFHQLNTLLAQLGAPNTPKKRTVSLATR